MGIEIPTMAIKALPKDENSKFSEEEKNVMYFL